jgi:hypothetical protein
MRAWIHRHKAALALVLLSPAIAELLSGSTPITELFVAPAAFALGFGFDLMLYGSGVLLVREAAVRWRKGWMTILLLGAGYGILEEGLAVHTFFQPGGAPVGLLGQFGRVAGLNTVWAVGLTVFHAVYSIALPILLVRLIYPEMRETPFLSRRGVLATGLLYVGTVAFFAALVPYRPSWAWTGVAVLVLGLLLVLAYRAPREFLRPRAGPPTASRGAFVLAGMGLMIDWVVVGLAGPQLFRVPALAIAVFLGVCAGILVWVRRHAGTERTEFSEYWFAAGAIGFFFGWDLVLEFVAVPGILLVAAGFGVFLVWLHRRLARATAAASVPVGALGGPHGA